MYTTIKDFLKDWSLESEGTLKVLKNLTDASLSQKATAEGRSLGFLAWHIVGTINEMLGRAGLAVEGPDEHAPVPAKAAEIASAYEKSSASLVKQVSEYWTDASLNEKVNMYGEEWKKKTVLLSLVRHQVHHRAQMTVLMRQAGLKVPGLYGPSREEWAQMGMKAPE